MYFLEIGNILLFVLETLNINVLVHQVTADASKYAHNGMITKPSSPANRKSAPNKRIPGGSRTHMLGSTPNDELRPAHHTKM